MTKILLVEDDKSLREIYSVRLLAEGYTLISSGDGEEALAAAIGEKPDLIISDVMMPKISGFEMLDLLRSNENTKNIPVIMLTALSSEQQRERGNRLGADRYLIKSQVGIEDIVRTVHDVLGDAKDKRNLDQMQTSVSLGNERPAQPATDQPQAAPSSNQPSVSLVLDNPSITTSNFPNMVNPQPTATPADFQSSFNPPEATNPAAVTGEAAPQLPDTPMNIPSRMVQQPGMPASYAAATQSAENNQTAGLATTEPVVAQPTMATPGNMASSGQPIQPLPQPQPSEMTMPMPPVRTQFEPAPQTQAMPAGSEQVQQISPFAQQQFTAAPSAPTAPAQFNSQPVEPTHIQQVAQPETPAYMSATPAQPTEQQQALQAALNPSSINASGNNSLWASSSPTTPVPASATTNSPVSPTPQTTPTTTANEQSGGGLQAAHRAALPDQNGGFAMQTNGEDVNTMRNSLNDSTLSGKGGERVIAPPTEPAATGPRINIDELLAGSDGSSQNSMFPDNGTDR